MDRHGLSAMTWIKSSYSGDNGGDCVEMGIIAPAVVPTWIKSSYSDNNGGNCVEIAPAFPAVVPVRDSKVVEGPVLVVTRAAWSAFTEALR
ncbi:DUF397 domain-containing protein [Streptomyces sp. NPDC088196]|uniref:DUF397 domain-containing protein n=1 Tax=Streptomyces sp. NPDC088196 TaxID=3154868 RepID=UPI00344BA2DC